ncbi:MAG: hypothetical protein J0I12_11935 [Candidatus Eremiobacteraeota bacterium]|nr:hypothetical protein [Candidatus Eremiobacteraeota bacterium]
MRGLIWGEKLLSLGLAAVLVAWLDWRSVIRLMIVLGQGHFLLAYFYQFRAGKIGPLYVLNYGFWACLILLVYWMHPFAAGLTAVATVYFAWHMAVDEFYLSELPLRLRSSPLHLGRLLEMLPLMLVYAAAVVDAMLAHGVWREFPELMGPALQLTSLSLLAYVALIGFARYRPDGRSCYFLVAGGCLDVAAKLGWLQQVQAPKLSGFIILFHYFSWYLHYYLSLERGRGVYLRQVALVNVLVLGLYGVFGAEGLGWLLFQEQNFYLWTLMHLISSTRRGDLVGLLRWPGR